MTPPAIELTEEHYTELVADLTTLNVVHRNPWARSWLEILGTVPEPNARRAVLAALIRGLPALYRDFERLSLTIAGNLRSELEELEAIQLPPKPPSVPDTLGALFEPLARGEEE